jgi:hypothetical protein
MADRVQPIVQLSDEDHRPVVGLDLDGDGTLIGRPIRIAVIVCRNADREFPNFLAARPADQEGPLRPKVFAVGEPSTARREHPNLIPAVRSERERTPAAAVGIHHPQSHAVMVPPVPAEERDLSAVRDPVRAIAFNRTREASAAVVAAIATQPWRLLPIANRALPSSSAFLREPRSLSRWAPTAYNQRCAAPSGADFSNGRSEPGEEHCDRRHVADRGRARLGIRRKGSSDARIGTATDSEFLRARTEFGTRHVRR